MQNLSAQGISLVVSSTTEGATNLSAPAAIHAIWTKVNVAYATDTARSTLQPNATVVYTVTLTYAHDGSPVVGGKASVRSTTPGDPDRFTCSSTNATGQCTIAVSKALGNYTFNVTGFSTKLVNGVRTPYVTANVTQPARSYRWTAISFLAFSCSQDGTPTPCQGHAFRAGVDMVVTATAVAADTGEALPGATFHLKGQPVTADATGTASVTINPDEGAFTILASGDSATIGGETVTWSQSRAETATAL